MAKPYTHAVSSARRFGGVPEDYLPIHEFMDSSKIALADNRHRALTHTSWFIEFILPKVFGSVIENSDGKKIPIASVGEQHCLEDFGNRFIPTPQDYLANIPFEDWMNNGSKGDNPPSFRNAVGVKVND